jgi:hypothetical protein
VTAVSENKDKGSLVSAGKQASEGLERRVFDLRNSRKW